MLESSESEEDEINEYEEDEDEPPPPSKKQKTQQKVVELIDTLTVQPTQNIKTTNQKKRKRKDASKPTTTKCGIETKKIPNKKLIVFEERPHNNIERESLWKDKNKQTLLAFINFPAGQRTRTTREVKSDHEYAPKKATLPKLACKVSKAAPRAVYKSYSDPAYKAAMDIGIKSMFETEGGKEAHAAIKMVSIIIIPRSTLCSRSKTAKKKLEAEVDDPHEDAGKENLQLFYCM